MGRPFLYAALGDSTAVGYGAGPGEGYVDRLFVQMAQRKALVQLANLGALGARLADIVATQAPRAERLDPHLVTFFVGTNDLMSGAELAGLLRRLDAALNALDRFACPVIVATLPDLCQSPLIPVLRRRFPSFSVDVIRQRVDAFNARLRARGAHAPWHLVEMFAASTRALIDHPDYFCADGVHPSSLGYAAIAEALWPAVERAIGASRTTSALASMGR